MNKLVIMKRDRKITSTKSINSVYFLIVFMITVVNMQAQENGFIEVPGAKLYYEKKGDGPVLLMIPGANGDHFIFNPIRDVLSKNFTVITYDRRGFSASELTVKQDYKKRLSTDADDAAALIRVFTDKPAFVFASSSGALVSLQLLIQHSDVVEKLIAHEPTLLKVLPDSKKWIDINTDIYNVYKSAGIDSAMALFVQKIIPGTKDGELMKQGKKNNPNVVYWFEHELLYYPVYDYDIAELRKHKDKLIFAVGSESSETMPAMPNKLMAKDFETEFLYFPGGHLGYLLYANEFGKRLSQELIKKEE
jgi:acetyltransferase/esterase